MTVTVFFTFGMDGKQCIQQGAAEGQERQTEISCDFFIIKEKYQRQM